VRKVPRSPATCSEYKDRNVEVGENAELLSKEVEGDGQNSANRETPQKAIVNGTGTEHLLGTESTP